MNLKRPQPGPHTDYTQRTIRRTLLNEGEKFEGNTDRSIPMISYIKGVTYKIENHLHHGSERSRYIHKTE